MINVIHLCLMTGHKVARVTTFVRSLRTCIVFVVPFHLVTVNHKHRLLSTCWLLHCTVQSGAVTFALNFNPNTWLEARLSLVFYHVMWSVVSCTHRSIRLLWNRYYVCSSVRYYFDIVRYYVWWNHVQKECTESLFPLQTVGILFSKSLKRYLTFASSVFESTLWSRVRTVESRCDRICEHFTSW